MEHILYFSSDDWDSGLKTSQYHIALGLAKNNKVLYVNSIGLRKPRASKRDLRKMMHKLTKWFRGTREVQDRLYVITPIVIPFHNSFIAQKINRWLLVLYIKYFMKKLDFKTPLIVTFLPNVINILGCFGEKKVIYYCADQLSSFQGAPSKTILEMERELLKRANVVFVTSQHLYDEKNIYNKNTYYIPHGVNYRLFRSALSDEVSIPQDISYIKKPIIGFFGLISRDWIDFDLLIYIAQKHPDWSMILIGKCEQDIPDLTPWDNIILLGPRPYEQLPGYCKAFDVALIPFVISELTINSNPLKLKEYLAAGNPVVSTKIPEVEHYRDLIHVAGDYKEFVFGIEEILRNENGKLRTRRSEAVRDESWEGRMLQITNIISGS
jgi:glycosyltransferase involved in cell wall biosynthesis